MDTPDSDTTPRSGRWLAIVAIGLCALVPAGVALAMTRSGPGITVDGSEYVSIAQQFRDHGALAMPYQSYDEPYQVPVRLHPSIPQTQFPPAWPIAVGATSKVTGADPLTTARWLDAAFLLVLGLSFGALVWRVTRSPWIAAGATLLLAMPDVLIGHAQIWAEPLTLLSLMGVLTGVERRTSGDARRRWLALIAGALVVGVLTRYVAIGFGLAAIIALWRHGPSSKVRWRDTALLAGACAVPLGLWTLRTKMRIGRPSERPLGFHPPNGTDLAGGVKIVARWLGGGMPHPRILLVVAIAAVIAWRVSVRGDGADPALPRLVGVFTGCYLVTVLAARTLVDAHIPLDGRILLPLYPLALLALAGWLARPGMGRAAAALFVIAALVLAGRDVDLVRRYPTSEVAGYRSTRWSSSPTMAYLRGLDASTVVITNAPDAVRFLVGDTRTTLFTPLEPNLYSGGRNDRYGEELRSLARAFRGHPSVLVHFFRPTRGNRREINPKLVAALHVHLAHRFHDAVVYVPDAPA